MRLQWFLNTHLMLKMFTEAIFFKPMCINIEYLWFLLGQFFSSHFCILYYSLLYYHLDFCVQD